MIKALIVDDEEHGRNVLENLIRKYCPDVSVVGKAGSAKEAKRVIEEVNPSLVFLDIEMPGGSGFELLESFPQRNFSVIFTTAYDQYAVKAFKFSAIDYLLKPINIEELMNAVKKLSAATHKKEHDLSIKHLVSSFDNSGVSRNNNNIAVPTHAGLRFIDIDHIIHCEADGKYTWCYTKELGKIHSTRSLKDFEEQLDLFGFCRIHHAHLINVNHIKSYTKGDGGSVTLSNGDEITVSKRKKEDFLKRLNKI
ncbi:MAG TPA: LytTR family DNA-binding domain-containing protein [Bacteroidia bacterium]|jgi:two-component system LytT family response regulator